MNNERYVYIDTLSVLSKIDTVFVEVDEKFTELLREKILTQYRSLEAFNKKVTHMERHAFAWAFKTKNGHQLNRLLKMCKSLGIPEQKLRSSIKGYYSWGSHNKPIRIPESLKITPRFVEGYALYVAEGDTGYSGKSKARKLRLTNSAPSVINFFADWAKENFPGVQHYTVAMLPDSGSYEDTTTQLQMDKGQLRMTKGHYNKKIKYRFYMDKAIIIDLILDIDKPVKEAVLWDDGLASAYLRGLMAGEGTVYNNRSKYVRLEMKNHTEIEYAKKLLAKLGINFTSHKRSNREGMESIYIGGKENIRRYYELVGFGCQEERQRKLKALVEADRLAAKSKLTQKDVDEFSKKIKASADRRFKQV
jgi:hypothetical protein